VPLTAGGSIPTGTLDSFMWGSYPASLRNVGGSTQVPIRAWNNARWGTRGLPPPVKLERRDMTYTVLMWRKTQNKQNQMKGKDRQHYFNQVDSLTSGFITWNYHLKMYLMDYYCFETVNVIINEICVPIGICITHVSKNLNVQVSLLIFGRNLCLAFEICHTVCLKSTSISVLMLLKCL
jgi:hypothetical protein